MLVLLFVLAQLLSGPVFAQHCTHPATRTLSSLSMQFAPFSSFSVPIVLQFIFNMFKNSISGMPHNASPPPGTTKKMHFFVFVIIFNFYFASTLLCNCCVVIYS